MCHDFFFQWLSMSKIKVLSLRVESNFPLVEGLTHIAAMRHLEDLEMKFSMNATGFKDADDVLLAISAGCENLKKLSLHSE